MSADTVAKDELAEFTERCRAFLDEHAVGVHSEGTPDPRGVKRLAVNKKFQQALAEAGLAGIVYPTEYGGAGLTRAHDRVWRDTYAEYPNMSFEFTISHGMCLPMLAEYGTHEQKTKFLADKHQWAHRLVPDVLRTRGRIRRCQPSNQSRTRRRHLDHQRPEGMDHPRSRQRLRRGNRPH